MYKLLFDSTATAINCDSLSLSSLQKFSPFRELQIYVMY